MITIQKLNTVLILNDKHKNQLILNNVKRNGFFKFKHWFLQIIIVELILRRLDGGRNAEDTRKRTTITYYYRIKGIINNICHVREFFENDGVNRKKFYRLPLITSTLFQLGILKKNYRIYIIQ